MFISNLFLILSIPALAALQEWASEHQRTSPICRLKRAFSWAGTHVGASPTPIII